MSRFLEVVTVAEAIDTVVRIAPHPARESVDLHEAAGRVLSADVCTDSDIPGFDRSVVDGYAVTSADTTGASDAIPAMLKLKGKVSMGDAGSLTVRPGDCVYVPTGGVLPAGADAVVMVEHAEVAGDTVLVRRPAAHHENLILKNEDFSKGAVVLQAGRRLSAQDTGVLAAAGCTRVPVAGQPVIGIISTGNELVPVTAVPAAGQVRDANAPMIGAFVSGHGCIPRYYGIVQDERSAFEGAVTRAVAECDAVLLSGGSSKDDRDLTAAVIAGRGELLVHGIAISPGKPTIIGRIAGKPVIGLPGHPASAFVVLIAIVQHLLGRMTGAGMPACCTTPAILTRNIPSPRGREDYVRVTVADGSATPVFGKSGLLNTLVRSDGVVRIPAESEGLEKGSTVEVILW